MQARRLLRFRTPIVNTAYLKYQFDNRLRPMYRQWGTQSELV
jgi:hypothetical protein